MKEKAEQSPERPAAQWGRILVDLVIAASLVGAAMMFFSQNGFIGSGDIQPYPY